MPEAMAQAIRMTTAERQATGGGTASGTDGDHGGVNTLTIHKYYTRLERFNGEGWMEWYYQFGVATSTYNHKNAALLEVVEKLVLNEVATDDIWLKMNDAETEWMKKTHAEIVMVL